MIDQKKLTLVLPEGEKNSQYSVINNYAFIVVSTLLLSALHSWYRDDIHSARFILITAAFTSLSFIFNKFHLYDLAKSIMFFMLSIIIFYFGSFAGVKAGTHLFYFPFLLAVVNIYDFQKPRDRLFIILYLVFNLILIGINIATHHVLFRGNRPHDSNESFFNFNLFFSILCIGYFLYLIITMNIRQKNLIQNLTEEMMKSKLSEEKKELNTNVLMAELQHRLKNNLSLMSSLIRIKLEGIDETNMNEKIDETSHAIQVVADANKSVIFNDNSLNIPAETYFKEVIDSWGCFPHNRKANFSIEPSSYYLSIKLAIPIALIIHELIVIFCKLDESKDQKHYLKINVAEQGVVNFKSSVSNLLEICKDSEHLVQVLADQIDAEIISISSNEFKVLYKIDEEHNAIESESIFA